MVQAVRPDVVYMRVDDVRTWVEIEAPNRFEQALTCDKPSDVHQKFNKKTELDIGQENRVQIERKCALDSVDPGPTEDDLGPVS